MPLGTFKATAGAFVPATKFEVADNLGHPLIVIVRDFNEEFSTTAYPEPRAVAFVMIADLSPVAAGKSAELYVNAILGGSAVADRLKSYAGAVDEDGTPVKLPVKLGIAKSKEGGRRYQTIEPLSGAELELAKAWDTKNPTALTDEYDRLKAIAEAEAGNTAPVSNSNKFSDDALNNAIAGLR